MLVYATLAFSLWMLIDAIRRSAAGYWILIIIFVPFGALIYFFGIKLRDYRPWFERLMQQRSRSIEELMARYEATPSQSNQLSLATAFYDAQRFEQAASLFSDVLEKQPTEPAALWGLARVRRSQGNDVESVRLYEQLIETDPRYGDYAAALEYAETLWDAGQGQRALEILEDLAQESRRLNHHLAFAHYLVLSGDKARAKRVLGEALKEHDRSPGWLKKKQRQWALSASEMLGKLNAE